MNGKSSRLKWWVLGALTASISMTFIDITVLPVALPTLQRELHLTDLGVQWAINAYTLILTALLLSGGRLAQIFGLRRIFCLGLILFAGASALCGLSQSQLWLLTSRGLQGLGGAMMLPSAQAIITANFPSQERGKATGIYVSIGSIFLALGPLIGGSLTEYISWRAVFWINLPIAAIGLLLTLIIVPKSERKPEVFDPVGFLMISLGIVCLITALMQVQNWGWASLKTLSLLCAGLSLLYLCLRWENRTENPLIDLNILKQRSFIAGSGCIFFNQLAITVTVFWAIYFQNILDFSPAEAGFCTFLGNAPILFSAPIAGYLVDRLGPRLPVATGFFLILFSLMWFATHPSPENFYILLPTLIPFGMGVPLVLTPSFVSMINSVPPAIRATAAGINIAVRQFGSTLGLAILGTLFFQTQDHSLQISFEQNQQAAGLNPEIFKGLLSKTSPAVNAYANLHPDVAPFVQASLKNAFLAAFSTINIFAMIFCAIGLALAFSMLKDRPIHD